MKNFTAKQKEIIARKLGYDGPMQGFDEFVQSSPALAMKYEMINDKYTERMNKGGAVMKYQAGGAVPYTDEQVSSAIRTSLQQGFSAQDTLNRAAELGATSDQLQRSLDALQSSGYSGIVLPSAKQRQEAAVDKTQQATPTAPQLAAQQSILNDPQAAALAAVRSGYASGMSDEQIASMVNMQYGKSFTADNVASFAAANNITRPQKQVAVAPTQYGATGVPQMGTTAQVTPAQTAITDEMRLRGEDYLVTTPTPQAQQRTAVAAAPVAVPAPVTPQPIAAAAATPGVQQAVAGITPATGVAPTIQAAQLTEEQKQAAMAQAQQLDRAQQAQLATRTLQQGELVSGPTVDMGRVEQAIAQTEAAQGRVTEDMTVQGQLTKLTANFDASNPPPWAAGAIRSVTAQLAARGLSASSMAGQAVVQAALEMATPIASADAAAYQQMAAQNLSNRQQVAILSAQQRAQFLGQEFDQTFQTRVLNAAKIADIANMNFTAQQQVYLENARLAQSVDLANLNNRQATVIANAATLASMEMANLGTRQQAAVVNAQNFLQMELTNMSNAQQASLFKAQQLAQAALSDAAAENSVRQFNAVSKQQADQFNAGLSTQVNQFNAAQYNAIEQFNAGQANALSQFNAQMQEQRQEFNARNRIIIDQANAQLVAQISTANTAAINAANFQNAQSMNNMTLAQYNNEVQLYRDQVKMVFDSYERAEDRAASMATAVLQADLAREKISAETSASYGKLLGSIVGTKVGEKALDGAWGFIKNLFTPTGG